VAGVAAGHSRSVSKHESVWLATAAHEARAPLDRDIDADVVIAGAGIVGLTTALRAQQGGARVVVLEAREVAAGTTGNTTGKVTSQHSLTYADLIRRQGRDRAGLYADANQYAIEMVAELVDATRAECQFERAPAYVYATDARDAARLEAEDAAARELGLPSALTTEIDLPFAVELALRFDNQAHFHPVRYCAALARAIVAGGGTIFEHTRAVALDEEQHQVVVRTPNGNVRADQAVVATLLPFLDRGGFFAKARATRAYGVAARLHTDAPAGMHISAGEPVRSTRPWIEGDRRGIVVVGESHPTGEDEQGPARWGALEQWARDNFSVDSFEYRWSAQDYTTADDVPYVGRSPRTKRTFVATGMRKWGLTNGTAAATVLSEALAGRDHRWLELFDATRVGNGGAMKKLVTVNAHVARRLVQDRIGRVLASSGQTPARGEAAVVRMHGHTVGAYRDPQGTLHAVNPTCTHLGCALHWNRAETSWDCPCHGSRFSYDGEVLEGPAVRDLDRVDVDESEPTDRAS
jgi:glycine/D-amino acid oxidase-like deaminating enzyme/nitrite reductase/ring-hydroxylating ferredoxin subunit